MSSRNLFLHINTVSSQLSKMSRYSTYRSSFDRKVQNGSLRIRRVSSTNTAPTPVVNGKENNMQQHSPVLVIPEGVNAPLQRMEYAVRGQLVLRAENIAKRLGTPSSEYPFDKIVYCNIGNPQSVGQSPLTYVRQVLAAMTFPELLKKGVLPSDLSARAETYLKSCHGIGAYSESAGLRFLRERVARAIERRDGGVPCSPDRLFFTNGASEAVKIMLQLIVREKNDGVMLPIPQYPLYSATITALDGEQVNYYLDEDNAWGLDIAELEQRLAEARSRGGVRKGTLRDQPRKSDGTGVITQQFGGHCTILRA